MLTDATTVPRGDLEGLRKYARYDFVSGFLVFLIALPLCLGISLASGYPAIAGIFTAIVGGLVTPLLSNSELTIKGPAAGLIVIALGAITELGAQFDVESAYRLALGVGVAAGIIQIVFGLTRSGTLGDAFPTSVVHGMLAAIGVIIIAKQVHITLGVLDTKGSTLELISQIPHSITNLNPKIAVIGLVSLAILFALPFVKIKAIRKIPAPMLVILVAVPLGMYFDLSREHTYTMGGVDYPLSEKFLVSVPNNLVKAIATPDFRGLATFTGWKWVALFALIGSLESILSAKAIDLIDPWKRKTNLNRDLIAVGLANTISAGIGGLPMISEIVRSKANVDSGARTRFADMFHSLCLLGFVAFLPSLIHRIPLAALSAMLVYTGSRLASPREFQNIWRVGKEQLVIFVATLVGVLLTDLLIGVLIGVVTKFAIHMLNGVPLRSMFRPFLDIEVRDDGSSVIYAKESAVFSNWLPFKRQIEQIGLMQRSNLTIDLSEAKLVDHSVMEKLHELQEEFEHEGLTLELVGLQELRKLSSHDLSARRKGLVKVRRLTFVTEAEHGRKIAEELYHQGASGFTILDCRGSGKTSADGEPVIRADLVRVEVLVNLDKCGAMMDYLSRQARAGIPITLSAETVEVDRFEHY